MNTDGCLSEYVFSISYYDIARLFCFVSQIAALLIIRSCKAHSMINGLILQRGSCKQAHSMINGLILQKGSCKQNVNEWILQVPMRRESFLFESLYILSRIWIQILLGPGKPKVVSRQIRPIDNPLRVCLTDWLRNFVKNPDVWVLVGFRILWAESKDLSALFS